MPFLKEVIKLPKYKAAFRATTWQTVEFEAENLDKAYEHAEVVELDDSEVPNDEWELEAVDEIPETE